MFGMGMPEILLILAVALIVIGPKKLPDLAKSLGRAIGEFRKATTDIKESMVDHSQMADVKTAFQDLNDNINNPLAPPKTPDKKTGSESGDDIKRPAPDSSPKASAAPPKANEPELEKDA